MEYFKLLNLYREPFSNSPEPDFFYQSTQHVECLQKLELAIRLRRGLNTVIGDVGTGKTTLCRQLIRRLDGDERIKTHLLLDPYFSKPSEFLATIAGMFRCFNGDVTAATEWQLREAIKNYLFDEGLAGDRSVVLIIDEGQKIPDFCLEILREFLNYETNEYKLLQIVIFAQEEFGQVLQRNPGFADRINYSCRLGPLGLKEASAMIRYRVDQAREDKVSGKALFSLPALLAIYRATGGYPRKIVILCHQIILALIVQNKSKASWRLVRASVKRGFPERKERTVRYMPALAAGAGAAAVLAVFLMMPERTQVSPAPEVREAGIKFKSVPVHPPETVAAVQPEAVKEVSAANIQEKVALQSPQPQQMAGAPALLGQVHVKKKNVVWTMIEDIYGECTIELLRAVAALNPQIRDLDYVYEGDTIKFPAVAAVTTRLPQDGKYCWIQVAEKKKLDDVYALFKNSAVFGYPPLQITPYWNAHEGLAFSLILRMSFESERDALEAIKKLPDAMASNARVISDWGGGTVFYARLPV